MSARAEPSRRGARPPSARPWRRRAPSLALVALALALAVAAPPARGQPYDPRYRWRTVETPHFRVHFHGGLERLARRVAGAAERAHELLVPRFAHLPARPTEVVLSDDTDDANGSATPLPYDTIRLFGVPPDSFSELSDERDWVEGLVVHEYVHVLHLGTIEGLPALVNAVLGRVLAPTAFTPPLVAEGLAVLHEGDPRPGAPDDGGRNRSALFDMYARALATDGPFPRLDEALGQPLAWPRGNVPYLLGGRLLELAERRAGPEALTALSKDQGRQLWPYRTGTLVERHLGDGMERLWAELAAETLARADRARGEVAARPVTEPRPLTRRGSRVLHPRWLSDGSGLVYFDAGPDERAAVRRVRADGRDLGRVATVEGNGAIAMRGPGELVVAASDVHEEFHVYDDLRLVELATGRWRALTSGARATDPDVAPDGGSVVYAAHVGDGEMALLRLPLGGGPVETLLRRPGLRVFAPRISPDGRRIALEVEENGRRDVALLEDGRLSFVTDDDALDLQPSWSPDGRTLFFASERTGIYDLYAFELEERGAGREEGARRPRVRGRLRQVTNVETGAFEPQVSPDGRTLAFVTYSRRGYDLAAIPLDPATWLEPAPPRARPLRGPDGPPTPPPPELADRPYRALDSLRPTFWLPWLGADGGGTTLGAVTGGSDALFRHVYALQAWYGFGTREPQYDAQYVGTWLFPRLTLGSSRSIGTTPGEPSRLEEDWNVAQVSLRATDTHLDRQASLAVGWRALRLRSIGGAPGPSGERGVAPFRDGTASELSLTWARSDAFRFVNSISPEEGGGFSVGCRFARPELGGGTFTYASARAAASRYLRVPGTAHTVLALRGSLGVASGSLGGRQPFSLGGAPASDVAELVLAPFLGASFPADVLRGYPSGALAGSSLLDANAELRFPIAAPERGLSTWPVQLRRVHGAAFLDAGGAFRAVRGDPLWRFAARDRVRFGAGAELRLELVLGYGFRTDFRLGVARGLGPLLAPWRGGRPPSDPLAETQVYFTLGPSF